MEMTEYQDRARQTAVYAHRMTEQSARLNYVTLGLVGEAGEFANKVKKIARDGEYKPFELSRELGDVLWYVAMAAAELGISLETIAWDNVEKLAERAERGKLHGNGDER